MRYFLAVFAFLIIFPKPAFAVPETNNRFGINVLSPEAEIKDAASMVNNGGDWGWIIITIRKDERDLARWQKVLDQANLNHLIPIVRIATGVKDGVWEKPLEGDSDSWADFLSKLYWPTKRKYVQVYNEVNRADEWGGRADGREYARELNKTADDLKKRSGDFFTLQSPMDLSVDHNNGSMDAGMFFSEMNNEIPGIFTKIDGLASHSYPNPDFSADPLSPGRFGISGYKWEQSQVEEYLSGRQLPVFITETGWKRATQNDSGLSEEKISEYFKVAFENVWNDKNIAVVAPFVFHYPSEPFYKFSFKGKNGSGGYFNYFYTMRDLPKVKGEPERENSAFVRNIDATILKKLPNTVILGRKKKIMVLIRNTGNFIWDSNNLKLNVEGENLEISEATWEKKIIYPGEDLHAEFNIKTHRDGLLPVNLKLIDGYNTISEFEFNVNSASLFSFILLNLKGSS